MTLTADVAPVTVTITRTAPEGRDREVLAWLQTGISLAEDSPGFLGAGWIRPTVGSRDWHVLYRFADAASLAAWEGSEQRTWWLGSGRGLMTQTRAETRTGIEGWFDPPQAVAVTGPKPPPRWKQGVTIYTAFFPLSLLAGLFLTPHLVHLDVVLRVFISTITLTPIMTYLALPRVTRALEWWLLGQAAPWKR